MAQKPVLRGEVGCACVAREVSVERGGMGERGCASGAQHILRQILSYVLRHVLRRVPHVLVPYVLVLHVSPKGKPGVGSAAGR